MANFIQNSSAILAKMAMIPDNVGTYAIYRMTMVSNAIEEGLIDGGTVLMPFNDLGGDKVVLTVQMRENLMQMYISRQSDEAVISLIYQITVQNDEEVIRSGNSVAGQRINHQILAEDAQRTDRGLENINSAKRLMRTLPMFRTMA